MKSFGSIWKGELMAVEKKLVKKALNDFDVKRFLEKELERAGVSEISIQKTPIATRISILVRRPGIVVGKKGKAIKELCEELQQRFGIENPQIEVVEVTRPELDAKLMAEKIGKQIELNPSIKPIIRSAIREIMGSGAVGAEIRVAGKIVGKGAKAKALTARAGYLKKSGESMKVVHEGRYVVYLNAGAIGIQVRIVPPDASFSDKIIIQDVSVKQPATPTADATASGIGAVGESAEAKAAGSVEGVESAETS